MGFEARYALLDAALDESTLWEVPLGLDTINDGGILEVHRPMPISQLRPDLIKLLRAGHVQLYDLKAPGLPVLPLDGALVVVDDDKNWTSPIDEPQSRDHVYCLVSTDTTLAEYRRARDETEQQA